MAEKEYIERDAEMNVCERSPITQAIKGGEKKHLLVVLSLGGLLCKGKSTLH